MTQMGRSQTGLVAGLVIALLASLGFNIYQSRRLAQVRQQNDADLQSLHETRVALREAERRIAESAAKPQPPPNGENALIAQRNITINQLNHELSQAHISITQLQAQLSDTKKESQAKLASANQQNDELKAKWQSRFNTMTQQLDSIQAALQDSRQRIAGLEAANAKLRSESNGNSARDAERDQLLTSLHDIDRRREAYLSSITDRCRDITNRFRAMSGMLDSNRQQDSSAFSGAALDLIENAISLTDDDLRHLSELNARAFRLEKQLSKK
jgi:chromosome segregation ATPase